MDIFIKLLEVNYNDPEILEYCRYHLRTPRAMLRDLTDINQFKLDQLLWLLGYELRFGVRRPEILKRLHSRYATLKKQLEWEAIEEALEHGEIPILDP